MSTIKSLFRILSHSTAETESAGTLLAALLEKGDFVAMYGDLGAGKTAFVRGVAALLAPEDFVTSPTYALVNQYGDGDKKLCHFDMYRIDSEDDLESIGFYDYNDCILMAEWCEKIPFAIPEEHYSVRIEKLSETERLISIDKIAVAS